MLVAYVSDGLDHRDRPQRERGRHDRRNVQGVLEETWGVARKSVVNQAIQVRHPRAFPRSRVLVVRLRHGFWDLRDQWGSVQGRDFEARQRGDVLGVRSEREAARVSLSEIQKSGCGGIVRRALFAGLFLAIEMRFPSSKNRGFQRNHDTKVCACTCNE